VDTFRHNFRGRVGFVGRQLVLAIKFRIDEFGEKLSGPGQTQFADFVLRVLWLAEHKLGHCPIVHELSLAAALDQPCMRQDFKTMRNRRGSDPADCHNCAGGHFRISGDGLENQQPRFVNYFPSQKWDMREA
jgi:hypothetical protein